MANHKSAVKRARQTETKTQVNSDRISRIRTFVRKVEEAISAGDKTAAQKAFQEAQPLIHSGVNKGVLHHNTAARKLSRLSAKIKLLSAK